MATVNTAHQKLLLTADLMRCDERPGLTSRRLDDGNLRALAFRFPPIEDLVNALDHIASREIAA